MHSHLPAVAPVRSSAVASVVLLALAVAGIAAVAYSLLVPGPFEWHVAQPRYWQGAIEVGVLLLLAWAALSLRAPAWVRGALLFVPVALYLRRHHVDGPLLAAWLWIEGLFALGALLLGRARGTWLREFLAGVALCGAILWLAQWFGYGTPRTQRLIALLVLLPPLLWRWRAWQGTRLLRAMLELDGAAPRLAAAALLALVCALFARSNMAADFDSLWYGFRPERVLVGENSVFDHLGLASPVYYFPKFWEVLTLPLAAAHEASLLQGASILCGGLLARLVFDWLRELGHGTGAALAGALLAWSIPAFANVTLGAKPDVFAALCTVALAWFAWQRFVQRDASALPWGIAAAGLAVSSKLAVMPYLAVAGFALLLATRVPALRSVDSVALRRGWIVLALCTLVGVLVCARTWWLSGLPTIGPEQLVALWGALGMHLRVPVGTLEWVQPQVWGNVPDIIAGWVIDPVRLSHIMVSWPSHVWLLFVVATLLFARTPAPPVPRWPLWLLPGCGLLLLAFIGFSNVGGDGNYFLAPVVMATIASFDLVLGRATSPGARRAVMTTVGLYAAFHFLMSFASATWTTGTREFDLDFTRGVRDSDDTDAQELEWHGLGGVGKVLHAAGGRMHVWGIKGEVTAYRLPARYENLGDVISAHWPKLYSQPALENLMACAGVEAWLTPLEPIPLGSPALEAIDHALRTRGAQHELFRDERWLLLSTQGYAPPCVR